LGQSYQLDAVAKILGDTLTTSTNTTVPSGGFRIAPEASLLQPMGYREENENDEPKLFRIAYERSPGVDFYAISITALDAGDETFVYDNPFFDYDTADVNFNMGKLQSTFEWAQNQPTDLSQAPEIDYLEIQWVGLPFFSRYYGTKGSIQLSTPKNSQFLILNY